MTGCQSPRNRIWVSVLQPAPHHSLPQKVSPSFSRNSLAACRASPEASLRRQGNGLSHVLECFFSLPVPQTPFFSRFLDVGAAAELFGRSLVYILPHKSLSCNERAVLRPAKTRLPKVKDSVCRLVGTLTHVIRDGASVRWGALCPACLSGEEQVIG